MSRRAVSAICSAATSSPNSCCWMTACEAAQHGVHEVALLGAGIAVGGAVEAGQPVDQAADLDLELAAHLGALDRRIAHRDQALHQVGDAAVVGAESLVPGARRIGEVAPDLGVLDEVLAQLDGALGEVLGDAGLAAVVVVHQPFVDDGRIAQPEAVVERLAVPVGRPLAAEIVDQRVVEPRAPAQPARFLGLAGLLLELAVHLGQHQEQRVLLLGAVGRRGADRLVDPRRHHVGEVADLLVAVGDAEQDAPTARARPSSAGRGRRPCRAAAARAAGWRPRPRPWPWRRRRGWRASAASARRGSRAGRCGRRSPTASRRWRR